METEHFHGGHFVFAFILIFLGIIFLLRNFGILPIFTWGDIVGFWPVILILLGVKIVFGKSALTNIIILIIGLIILILLVSSSNNPDNPMFHMGNGFGSSMGSPGFRHHFFRFPGGGDNNFY